MRSLALGLLVALSGCAAGRSLTSIVSVEEIQCHSGKLAAALRNAGDQHVIVEARAQFYDAEGHLLRGPETWQRIELAPGEKRSISASCAFLTAVRGDVQVRSPR